MAGPVSCLQVHQRGQQVCKDVQLRQARNHNVSCSILEIEQNEEHA